MGAHQVDIHVGKQLRFRRKLLGLNQEELGRAVGVTFQQVQKYERGINRIGSSRLYEFANALGVPVGYFFEGIDEVAPAEPSSNIIPIDSRQLENLLGKDHEKMLDNKETLALVRSYYRIADPALRAKILGLIKSMQSLQLEETPLIED